MTTPMAPPLHKLLAMRWWILIACGCSSSSDKPKPQPAPTGSASGTAIELPGDCNGIIWDAGALYLADDTHDQLAKWTDKGGFEVFSALPAAKPAGLGGLARLSDGSFVTPAFGGGTDGAVFATSAKGESKALEHIDATRRRIGVASDGAGGWYEAYFTVSDDHKHHGGVAHVGADGVEKEIVGAPLAKPVGLAANATTLYISDQELATVYAMALPAGELKPIATDQKDVDLLTLLPSGELVTGGKDGSVIEITPAGVVTTIAQGFAHVRGTAYDPAGKRLFVIDHAKGSPKHELHIVSLPPR